MPTWSRVAKTPGVFAITSVGHQSNQCEKRVVDIVKRVHPLPTVRVRAGKSRIEDIHEGEQAEIVFELEGTPPFTLGFQRSLPTDRNPHAPPVEQHTVTTDAHSYSVFTSQEGACARGHGSS